MSNEIDINAVAEVLNDKADRDLGNILLTNDALAQLRYLINDLDFDHAVNVTASTNDNVSYYTATSDGIFFGLNYGNGRFAVNGVRLSSDVTTAGERCGFLWFPLKKGDIITYWGGNWGGAGTQKFIPYKHQVSTNAQLLDGLNYQGKYATVNALLQVSPTHGRWALVGNDSSGYNRYFTRPIDNTFTEYEWADGGKDITVGDYVVDWKNQTATDPTWYRLYKSGWVEQGGRVYAVAGSAQNVTVTFPIEMANTYYSVTTGARTGSSPGDGYAYWLGSYYDETVNSLVLKIDSTSYIIYACWEVKGQAAQS